MAPTVLPLLGLGLLVLCINALPTPDGTPVLPEKESTAGGPERRLSFATGQGFAVESGGSPEQDLAEREAMQRQREKMQCQRQRLRPLSCAKYIPVGYSNLPDYACNQGQGPAGGPYISQTTDHGEGGACQRLCDASSDCVAFDVQFAPASNACRLYSDTNATKDDGSENYRPGDAGVDSRKLCFKPAPAVGYRCSVGQGKLGGVLAQSKTVSGAACARECDANAECWAFDWQRNFGDARAFDVSNACRLYAADTLDQKRDYGGNHDRKVCVKSDEKICAHAATDEGCAKSKWWSWCSGEDQRYSPWYPKCCAWKDETCAPKWVQPDECDEGDPCMVGTSCYCGDGCAGESSVCEANGGATIAGEPNGQWVMDGVGDPRPGCISGPMQCEITRTDTDADTDEDY